MRTFLDAVRRWHENGEVTWVASAAERLLDVITDTVEATQGRLNYNDALLVAVHREGVFDQLASFDGGFDEIEGLTRLS